jgi:Uma2 family endonuclease
MKLEYCDGEIYAMAGGTPTHADLAASVIRLLGNALLAQCRVSSSDLKVRIESTDLSTFPDVTVVCGERLVSQVDAHAVTNPTVLVEVTSPSTEDYDRGEKLSHYKQCPSVTNILIVSHRGPRVTVVSRDPHSQSKWRESEFRPGDVIELSEPQCSISVDEIYAGIHLDSV